MQRIDESDQCLQVEVKKVFDDVFGNEVQSKEIRNFLTFLEFIMKNHIEVYIDQYKSLNNQSFLNQSFNLDQYQQINAFPYVSSFLPLQSNFNEYYQSQLAIQPFMNTTYFPFLQSNLSQYPMIQQQGYPQQQYNFNYYDFSPNQISKEAKKKSKSKKDKHSKYSKDSTTVKSFNMLPLKSQQKMIKDLSTKSKSSIISKINDFLQYLLKLDIDSEKHYFSIISQYGPKISLKKGIKDLIQIELSHETTKILNKAKISLNSPQFMKYLRQLSTISLEIAYPTNNFNKIYDELLSVKGELEGQIKISIFIRGVEKTDNKFKLNTKIDSITLDRSVTEIVGNTLKIGGSFIGCSTLTTVKLPPTVTTIGSYCFHFCKNLREINIPPSVTFIGEGCFSGCSSLLEITIPPRLKTIEKWTFFLCSSLRKIRIPSSVTSIKQDAFTKCSSIDEFVFESPCNISEIESWTFSECSSLKQINVPDSVTKINDDAFNNCSGLKQISLPNSVRFVGSYAFTKCNSIEQLIVPSSLNLKSYGLSSKVNIIRI